MKRSVLAYILIPVMAAIVIVVGSLLMKPKAKTQPKPAAGARKPKPPAYKLDTVKGKEGEPPKFKAPDLKEKPLGAVIADGFIQRVLASAAKVTIERDTTPVPDKDKDRLAKLPTHIVSIEPAEFTSRDAVVIKIRKVEAPKKEEK